MGCANIPLLQKEMEAAAMNDPRILEIYGFLASAGDYVSVEKLSGIADVSPRTVREMIRESRDEIEKLTGAQLKYKSNYGYLLSIPDRRRFERFMMDLGTRIREEQYECPMTSESRIDWIIRHFLVDRTPMKSEDIAERLFVSRSTLAADLKTVRERLSKYGLVLQSRVGEGMFLSGSEKNIRTCISDYYFYDGFRDSAAFENQPLGRFDSHYQQTVEEVVRDVIHTHHYRMTDVGISNLIVHIVIALFRIESGAAGDEKSVMNVSLYPEEAEMSREIRDRLYEKTGIFMPDAGLGYLIMHMIGTRVFTPGDERLITAETINLTRRILNRILEIYNIDFFADIDLFTMLCTHIEPMLARVRNQIRMRNPMLKEIRKEDPVGYDMAVLAADLVAEQAGHPVDENEIGYLALHFELALERQRNHEKKSVLTVCASGAGTSRMLMYRMQTRFRDQISRIDSASLQDLEHIAPDQYDLIVTTVPLHLQTKARVLHVQYFLSESDRDEIMNVLRGGKEVREQVLAAFDEKLFIGDLQVMSENAAIHFLSQKLMETGDIPRDFESRVLMREKLSSTAMGNGVAMPHPDILMLKETKIVIAHTVRPFQWGQEKVNWIFLLSIAKEEDGSSEQLVQTLYELLKNQELMKKINEEPTYACFMQCMNELLSHNDSAEKESIFR